jgi:quinol monooxygenase YgiN
MATPAVKDMVATLSSGTILGGTPTLYQLEWVDETNFDFKKPGITKISDPYVIFAALDYLPDQANVSLPYWKDVVTAGRDDEPGTFVYGIAKDPATADKLFTIEAYESEAYLREVHVKSKAIEESIKNTKHLRKGLKHNFLKFVGGFLYKE